MCTVTFVPRKDGYILTHNRDEKFTRAASLPIQNHNYKGHTLHFPKDPDANGTWIALNQQHALGCLLNGGIEKHESQPPYRMSRGLVLLEALVHNDLNEFLIDFDLKDIEPFTLLLFNDQFRKELKWDGQTKHIRDIENIPQIWSSVTLYTPKIRNKRKEWFSELMATQPSPQDLFSFHHIGGEGNNNERLRMVIENSHKTVSITQVEKKSFSTRMKHINFVSEIESEYSLEQEKIQ